MCGSPCFFFLYVKDHDQNEVNQKHKIQEGKCEPTWLNLKRNNLVIDKNLTKNH